SVYFCRCIMTNASYIVYSYLSILVSWYMFVFFFQAEDGIRYLYVTGVQTCALPISAAPKCRKARSGCGVILASTSYTHEAIGQSPGHAPQIASARLRQVQLIGDMAICSKRSEEHTSELQSRRDLVCRLLLEKKKKK